MDEQFQISDSLLFEEVPCYISIQDKNCRILKINRKFRETFGDRLGDHCFEVLKQRNTKCQICPMDKTLADGNTNTSEEIVFSPEGYPVNVIAQTAPLYDKEGKITAVIEIATDITQTKRLQSRLEESTHKYRMLYNEVPCFISVQDGDFKILDSNRKFKQEFGEGRNKFCYEIYKHRTERCEVCPVAETFEDGNIHTSEEIVAKKNGEPMNVLVIAAPIKNEENEIISVMEMSTDITQIKKMQAQMSNVGQMMSNLAHTIKGIITGLDGGMYVVESGFKNKNEENIKKGWEMVQRNVERVSHLVLDMLFYAKERIPEVQEIQFAQLCRDINDLYQKKFQENNIVSNLDLKFNDKFYGDPKSIYTLVLNLVENAIDACRWDKEKQQFEINIKLFEESDKILFSVSDNGVGMSIDVKNKLFTPLYSTKGNSGNGFGLMVVKKIVEEHGGEIKVESEVGKGSNFVVKLPKRVLINSVNS